MCEPSILRQLNTARHHSSANESARDFDRTVNPPGSVDNVNAPDLTPPMSAYSHGRYSSIAYCHVQHSHNAFRISASHTRPI